MKSAHIGPASSPTRIAVSFAAAFLAAACAGDTGEEIDAATNQNGMEDGAENAAVMRDPLPEERRFASLAQLTFEGENAEAYFSSGRRAPDLPAPPRGGVRVRPDLHHRRSGR